MLSLLIKKKIETKYGAPIRYPKDCDALAVAIGKSCKCQISGSTIKRLFGLIKGTETPRMWTLDLIAFYLDYESWDGLVNEITENNSNSPQKIEIILSKGLKKGRSFKVAFGKKIVISIEYTGKGQFLLAETSKTPLKTLDVLEIEKIQLHHPLLIKKVKRNDEIMEGLVLGSITGVTEIAELEENSKIVSLVKLHINSSN